MRRKKDISFINCKKGSLELIFLVVFIFIIGISYFYLSSFFGDINDEIQDDDSISDVAKGNLSVVHDSFNSDNDNNIMLIFVGLVIYLLISAWFLDSHPVFFVVGIILLTISVMVIVEFANSFSEIANDPDLASTVVDYPKTVWLMSHIVEVIVSIAFLVAVITYGKARVL